MKAKYLHSDIDTLERVQIINDLRAGVFDVLVGINLLREGLDLPEVSLVAILDADKEGFLRSESALVQTCGRAARNVKGRVIMYADTLTKSIQRTLAITQERRALQQAYNEKHNITPKSTSRTTQNLLETFDEIKEETLTLKEEALNAKEIENKISFYRKEMTKAAKELQFEEAAKYRDLLQHYKSLQLLEDHP